MMIAVLDSNILMDMLNGVPEALIEISHYSQSYISAITWSEVMVGCILADQANPPAAADPVMPATPAGDEFLRRKRKSR